MWESTIDKFLGRAEGRKTHTGISIQLKVSEDYLQRKILWINFDESFQDVTVGFKINSAFYHLVYVSGLQSR